MWIRRGRWADVMSMDAAAVQRARARARRQPLRLAERQALIALGDLGAGFVGAVAGYVSFQLVVNQRWEFGRLGALFLGFAWVGGLLLVHGYSSLVPRSRLYSMASVAKAAV